MSERAWWACAILVGLISAGVSAVFWWLAVATYLRVWS